MKAIGLISGGLDSIIAGKVVAMQGIDVTMLCFCTPFFPCSKEKKARLLRVCKQINAKLKVIDLSSEFIRMLRKPKHGYGKNFNPCIDCKILLLKKAKVYAKKISAKFIFTGEVLGQRPMSQNQTALDIIGRETGLKGKLLRPLSAKLLPETQAELKRWVNREKLLAIHGRGRKVQLNLAKKYKIKEYQTPAGGCLLTCEGYCNKVKDLYKFNKKIKVRDVELLRYGRHFRLGKNKIIVGRNHNENKALLRLQAKELWFEVPGHGSPVTLLIGKSNKKVIELAAQLTARYSDATSDKVLVKYGKSKIVVRSASEKVIEKHRI